MAYLICQLLPYLTLDEGHNPTWSLRGAAVVLTTLVVSTDNCWTYSQSFSFKYIYIYTYILEFNTGEEAYLAWPTFATSATISCHPSSRFECTSRGGELSGFEGLVYLPKAANVAFNIPRNTEV